MYLFYGALDLTPDETYTVPTDHGVSSASVNGSITAPAIQPARRRLMQAGGVEEEGESLCRLSLKFRGYIAASYNNTKPWQKSNQVSESPLLPFFSSSSSSSFPAAARHQ